jgi:hypothetical protein
MAVNYEGGISIGPFQCNRSAPELTWRAGENTVSHGSPRHECLTTESRRLGIRQIDCYVLTGWLNISVITAGQSRLAISARVGCRGLSCDLLCLSPFPRILVFQLLWCSRATAASLWQLTNWRRVGLMSAQWWVWPPLWSSGQSSCLQIRRSGFDSWRYQIF